MQTITTKQFIGDANSCASFGICVATLLDETKNKQEFLPMYLFFVPSAVAFLAIFGISLRNQFAERTNI